MASDLKKFNATLAMPNTQEYLKNVLASKAKPFVANLTSLVANNQALQECEPVTLMYAGIKATALDLPLDANLGFAYVIPFKNSKKGVTEAQFQLGYKAFIQLALRSGQFETINVRDVREGEIVGEDFVSGEMQFRQLDANVRMNAPIIGYVGFFRLTNGFHKMLYMSKEEVEAHAKRYSQTYASKTDWVKSQSKWTTDFDAMAQKTIIKQLLSKYAPMSVEMQQAVKFDQSVARTENLENDYVDNEPKDAEEVMAEEIQDNAQSQTLNFD